MYLFLPCHFEIKNNMQLLRENSLFEINPKQESGAVTSGDFTSHTVSQSQESLLSYKIDTPTVLTLVSCNQRYYCLPVMFVK